jgi:hypothetical protein
MVTVRARFATFTLPRRASTGDTAGDETLCEWISTLTSDAPTAEMATVELVGRFSDDLRQDR